jgi:hypothetical protein
MVLVYFSNESRPQFLNVNIFITIMRGFKVIKVLFSYIRREEV